MSSLAKKMIVAFDTSAVATVRILLPLLPRGMARFAGSIFGAMGLAVSPERRKRAFDNLKNVLHGLPRKELKKICRECFIQSGAGFAEVFHMQHKKPQYLQKIVDFEGLDKVREAAKKKKGVIIVGSHLSAFPLGMMAMASLGFRVSVLVRQADNARVEEMSESIRRRFDLSSIYVKPRREAASACLRWLREGGILWMLVDQRYRKGILTNFLGKPSQVAPGAALFARRVGAPLIPAVTIRRPDSKYRVIIGEEIELPDGIGRRNNVKSDMEKILGSIEKYILAYPRQWTWFHKMWKVRKEALD